MEQFKTLYAQIGDVGGEDIVEISYVRSLEGGGLIKPLVIGEPNFRRNLTKRGSAGAMPAEGDVCKNSWKAAYHPFKTTDLLEQCLAQVRESTAHPDPSWLRAVCL